MSQVEEETVRSIVDQHRRETPCAHHRRESTLPVRSAGVAGGEDAGGGGYVVSIICPKGKGYEKSYEEIEGIAIYRHSMPFEANGALGYLAEYTGHCWPNSSCPYAY